MYQMVEDDGEKLCPPGLLPVMGRVSLWGRVVEHSRGWRAQYAYPYSLCVFDKVRGERLRARYAVEVEVT